MEDHSAHQGTEVTIDPVVVQNMNVRVEAVERRDLSRSIRTVGHLDYDEEREADMLRCFSLDDGAEIWRSTSGDSGTWEQVVVRGFGGRQAENSAVSAMAVYTSSLYAGTCHPRGGAQVWRSPNGRSCGCWPRIASFGGGITR